MRIVCSCSIELIGTPMDALGPRCTGLGPSHSLPRSSSKARPRRSTASGAQQPRPVRTATDVPLAAFANFQRL